MLDLSLQTLMFRGFFIFLFIFTLLYMFGVKKYTLFNKFLSQKRQPIWCYEKDVRYEKKESELFFVCQILDIYYSLNSIIYWIDLNLGHYSCRYIQKKKEKKKREVYIVWLDLFVYIIVYKKQGRSKTNLLDLLKRRRTEAVRKIIQLLHVAVTTSYQDATAR